MAKSYTTEILKDLEKRGLAMAGVIAINPKTGNLQVITYDQDGLVQSITDEYPVISLAGKPKVGIRAFYPLGEITTRDPIEEEK